MITYAIGDIHGMIKPLIRLLVDIKLDAGRKPYKLVFLGDYIDRGPDSKAVIQCLIDLKKDLGPENVITLMGNHEDMLLNAYRDWKISYGTNTLTSYDALFTGNIPDSHMDFIKNLDLFHETKYNIFVHAGIDFEEYENNKSMENQVISSLLWKRYPSGFNPDNFSKVLVHGHTPHLYVEKLPNRINLDSAAVFNGKLSAARFEPSSGQPVTILSVKINPDDFIR